MSTCTKVGVAEKTEQTLAASGLLIIVTDVRSYLCEIMTMTRDGFNEAKTCSNLTKYTPCPPQKHVTTFSTITLTIGVRLQ